MFFVRRTISFIHHATPNSIPFQTFYDQVQVQ